MKPILGLALILATTVSTLAAPDPNGLERLQGKWSINKTNDEGRTSIQTMEVKKNELTFQIIGADSEVRFVAKGKVETEILGPFHSLKVYEVEAGRSTSELKPSNDDRAYVYAVENNTLRLASNFDKERENQKAGLETYVRVAAAESGSGEAEAKLIGTWKLEVTLGDDTRDYEMRVARADGKLDATLISPRSGEHKSKSTTYKDGKLLIEVEREIAGSAVTFVYVGKLTGEALDGTVTVKDHDEIGTGQWKGKK